MSARNILSINMTTNKQTIKTQRWAKNIENIKYFPMNRIRKVKILKLTNNQEESTHQVHNLWKNKIIWGKNIIWNYKTEFSKVIQIEF